MFFKKLNQLNKRLFLFVKEVIDETSRKDQDFVSEIAKSNIHIYGSELIRMKKLVFNLKIISLVK